MISIKNIKTYVRVKAILTSIGFLFAFSGSAGATGPTVNVSIVSRDRADDATEKCRTKFAEAVSQLVKKSTHFTYSDFASSATLGIKISFGSDPATYQIQFGSSSRSAFTNLDGSGNSDGKSLLNAATCEPNANGIVEIKSNLEVGESQAQAQNDDWKNQYDFRCPTDNSAASKTRAGQNSNTVPLVNLKPNDQITISKEISLRDTTLLTGAHFELLYFQGGKPYTTYDWLLKYPKDSVPTSGYCTFQTHYDEDGSNFSPGLKLSTGSLKISEVHPFYCAASGKPASTNAGDRGVELRMGGDKTISKVRCFGDNLKVSDLIAALGGNASLSSASKTGSAAESGSTVKSLPSNGAGGIPAATQDTSKTAK